MKNEQIKELALGHGFTIKEGLTDLKPYVYSFARETIYSTLHEVFHDIHLLRQQTEPGAKGRRDIEMICKCLDVINGHIDILNAEGKSDDGT